jgi:hypothetical protein
VSFLHELKALAAFPREYRRALAAAGRYDQLKSGRGPVTRRQDISRQVFAEFYAPIDGDAGKRSGCAGHLHLPSSIAAKPL